MCLYVLMWQMCLILRIYVFDIGYKIIFSVKIMQPPFYWWHCCDGTVSLYVLLCGPLLHLSLSIKQSGIHFYGFSTALSI